METDTQVYVCAMCKEVLVSPQDLIYHWKAKKHTKIDPIRFKHICKACGMFCISEVQFRKHRKSNCTNHLKQFPCTDCPNIFSTPESLNYHQFCHLNSYPFKCSRPTCKESFRSHYSLERHFVRIHLKDKITASWMADNVVFSSYYPTVSVPMHDILDDSPPEVNGAAIEKSSFRGRKQTRHSEDVEGPALAKIPRIENENFQYISSDETSANSKPPRDYEHYILNLTLCDGSWIEKYVCSTANCDLEFLTKDEAEMHSTTVHFRENPFRCSYCFDLFATEDLFFSHLLAQHPNANPNRYFCNQCHCRFPFKYAAEEHVARYHTDSNFCMQCNLEFNSKKFLINHNCNNSLPFKCSECSGSYKSIWDLHFHVFFHDGKAPFKCKCYCQYSTITRLLAHKTVCKWKSDSPSVSFVENILKSWRQNLMQTRNLQVYERNKRKAKDLKNGSGGYQQRQHEEIILVDDDDNSVSSINQSYVVLDVNDIVEPVFCESDLVIINTVGGAGQVSGTEEEHPMEYHGLQVEDPIETELMESLNGCNELTSEVEYILP